MPNPEITDADRARWTERLEEYIASGGDSFFVHFRNEPMKQLWFAGEWLGEQLRAAGATEEENHDVCFAAGQCMAFRPDPWPFAVASLEKWKAGRPDKPGLELAEKLFQETFCV